MIFKIQRTNSDFFTECQNKSTSQHNKTIKTLFSPPSYRNNGCEYSSKDEYNGKIYYTTKTKYDIDSFNQ